MQTSRRLCQSKSRRETANWGGPILGNWGVATSTMKHGKRPCIVVRPLHPSLNTEEIFLPRSNLYGGQRERKRETMVGEGIQYYAQPCLVRPATLINIQVISLKQLFPWVSIKARCIRELCVLDFWAPDTKRIIVSVLVHTEHDCKRQADMQAFTAQVSGKGGRKGSENRLKSKKKKSNDFKSKDFA